MYLSKTHMAYFNIAKEVSKLSDFPRIKIGAVAVYKHKVISTGFNTQRTSPLQKKYNVYRFKEDAKHSCHAELSCLKPLIGRRDIDFTKMSLYIFRQYQTGELAPARPCASCQKLITELGIRHIYYTNFGGYSHEELFYEGE